MISFVRMEKYLMTKAESVASQMCPGQDIALFTIQLSIDAMTNHNNYDKLLIDQN